jgi:LysR family transcriptional regulator, hydrogen peroxide-inducible genes activator
MNFTLRQLEYFKALTEQRNFGRAAIACNVSQPALSVQIRALEASLGGALVERRARDVVVTPLGREMLELTRDVLTSAARLSRKARDVGRGQKSLALGIIPTLAPYLLPGVLAALRAGDLALNVQVREAQTHVLLEGLRTGDLDVAVVALPSGAAGLRERALFDDRFLLAGSAARLARLQDGKLMIRPTDIEASQLMLLEEGHCLSDQALEVCGMDRSGSGINMGASSLGTLSRLVAEGFGLTLMPELAARSEMAAAPGLCLRRFSESEPFRKIGIVCRESTPCTGWFDDLAELLQSVGCTIVGQSRTQIGLDAIRAGVIPGPSSH